MSNKKHVIWKFPFEIEDEQTIELPDFLIPLSVQVQDSKPALWAIVNPESPKKKLKIHIYGTGHEVGELGSESHIGTIQKDGFVWHVFLENKTI